MSVVVLHAQATPFPLRNRIYVGDIPIERQAISITRYLAFWEPTALFPCLSFNGTWANAYIACFLVCLEAKAVRV